MYKISNVKEEASHELDCHLLLFIMKLATLCYDSD
jgi:hypothetical protein